MKAWIDAARPRTLPLAIAGILLGLIPSASQEVPFLEALLTILTAVGLQIMSNFANDLGDAQNGADQHRTKGPSRAVQSGELSAAAMKKAVIISGVISFLLGLILLYFTLIQPGMWLTFALFMLMGCAGIWAAYHYTAGSNPYGYRGWGDVSVFVFFGLVAVMGTHVLIYKEWNSSILVLAIMQGALSAMVLHLNNMRDFEDDQKAGKVTLAIKMGWNGSARYFVSLGLLALSMLIVFLWNCNHPYSALALTPWLILIVLLNKVRKANAETKLDGDLKKVALSSFFIALCLFLTSIL